MIKFQDGRSENGLELDEQEHEAWTEIFNQRENTFVEGSQSHYLNLIAEAQQGYTQSEEHDNDCQSPSILSASPSHRAETTTTDVDDWQYKLVEEVRNYPCLWDVTSRAFKENRKKQEAWRRISIKLNIDVC